MGADRGVKVGGVNPYIAYRRVTAAYIKPVRFVEERWARSPTSLGAVADIDGAIEQALEARAGETVSIGVRVDPKVVQRYVAVLDKRYRVEPESAELVGLVAARLSISTEKFGREVRRGWMTHAIANRLASTVRRPLPLAFRELKPTVTKAEFGPVIVIQRGANVLTLYSGEHGPHLRRRHRLGPVPLPGRHVVDRGQAAESVVAPARLGGQGCEADSARAGESARHALDGSFGRRGRYPRNARRGSIGYFASHGCIRMRVPEAEWLFQQVDIGTPVVIV